jgi:hypothetical protein
MPDSASELARRLAYNAEAVCRHYLSSGRRVGAYWVAGDVHNTPGRSLYVRLRGPGAGKWTDAATGEHGDLLDLIRASLRLQGMREVMDEARRLLGLPGTSTDAPSPTLPGLPDAVRRLWSISRPIADTLAETYLQSRGIDLPPGDTQALRFHNRCFYRADPATPDDADGAWPALIVAVSNADGEITGLQRIWLAPTGRAKAPVATPRRAMGHLLGNAVRFGAVSDVMAIGEGIETVLSLRAILPTMPLAAALSAAHLAGFQPPPSLRRLYIARDNDQAGQRAANTLATKVRQAGIDAIVLSPHLGDFNDDLLQLGQGVLASALRSRLVPEDVNRFWREKEPRARTR